MVRAVASLDKRELSGLGLVERRLAAALFERHPIGERVGRVGTPCRGFGTDGRSRPYAALAVHHEVVGVSWIIGGIRPKPFVAPVEGGTHRFGKARRNGFARFAGGDI